MGGALQQDLELRDFDGKLEFDPGFRIGLEVGYQFNDSLAAGLNISGLIHNVNRITGLLPGDNDNVFLTSSEDVTFYQLPILANVRYTVPFGWKLKPFLEVGAGGVLSRLEAWKEGWFWGYNEQEEDFTFAYQGGGGLMYQINQKLRFGIAYKFLGSTEHEFGRLRTSETYSHSFLAQLIATF